MVVGERPEDPQGVIHDPDQTRAFRSFELAGWQQVPQRYDDAFANLTPQAALPLLDSVGVGSDTRLLDIATGPGYVAAAAAARGAEAVGIDFSSPMVEIARRRHPEVEFREGDAEALPFPGSSFDAVVMNFGLLHLARPEQALREVHRVLRPAGRFAFTVWSTPAQAVGFGIVLRAVAAHGDPEIPLPPGPPFFRFSDAAECDRALREAGFADPRVAAIPLAWRLSSAADLFRAMNAGTVRTAALLRAQSRQNLKKIRAAVIEEATRYRRGDAVVLPMPAVLAIALKR